jgi:hypothetical protein
MTNDVYTLFVQNFEDLSESNVALVARANTKELPRRFASVLSDSDLVSHLE